MRTTLTIDNRVLAAARSRARHQGVSVGEALSQLAMIGYEVEAAKRSGSSGFPMLPPVEGHVFTLDMVATALDDA